MLSIGSKAATVRAMGRVTGRDEVSMDLKCVHFAEGIRTSRQLPVIQRVY